MLDIHLREHSQSVFSEKKQIKVYQFSFNLNTLSYFEVSDINYFTGYERINIKFSDYVFGDRNNFKCQVSALNK